MSFQQITKSNAEICDKRRIEYLLKCSQKMLGKNECLSHYFLRKSMDISFLLNQKISDSLKETVCQNCGCLIIPSLTGKIRINHINKKPHKKRKIISTPLSNEYFNEIHTEAIEKQNQKENYKNHISLICFKCGNISHIPCCKKSKALRLENAIGNNTESKNKSKKKKLISVRELANKEIEKMETPPKSSLLNLLNTFGKSK